MKVGQAPPKRLFWPDNSEASLEGWGKGIFNHCSTRERERERERESSVPYIYFMYGADDEFKIDIP